MEKVKRFLQALSLLALRLFVVFVAVAVLRASDDTVGSISSALRGHDYARALELAQTALTENPKDVRLLTLKGLALSSLRRDPEALEAFRSAIALKPDYLPALEAAAQLEYKAGDGDAIPLLERLLKLKPDEQTAHAMRAVMAWRQKDCATAVRHFEQSRSVIASQPEALKEYGVCLVRLQRPGDAVPILQQVAGSEPTNKTAVYSVASAQLLAKQWNEALETLKPFTESGLPDSQALDLAATALEAMGDTPQAVAMLRQAIALNPRDPQLYVAFAEIALAHGSHQVGIDIVNAGLRRLPDSPQLYVARGVLEVQLARYSEADADFTKADQLDANLALGATARGLAAAEQNNVEKAISTVREELKTRKSDPFLYYVLAELLHSRGPDPSAPEFREALHAASKAVEMKPDFTLARDTLSRLYLQAGEPDKAIEQCRLALRSDPSDATAMYRLIRALQSRGRQENAREIADLLKQFSEVRAHLRQKENQEARFQLVEAEAPSQQRHP
ncbi:MAG: tetratricopeptide repeat protein [Acidobacteriaceae bacterium]|nr:tetratricopeptide repeat protein [Acidobacteriaceae bacterium]MBV9296761.1 tetratricopeptide repeat protein [Acidobacteriaceae bacterium]MBV9766474.1 tetratricopeptide repeat protein [Acidobacteriaceae bacterium]